MSALLLLTALYVVCVLALAFVRAGRFIDSVLACFDAMAERQLQAELERLQ